MTRAQHYLPTLDVGGTHVLGAIVDLDERRVLAESRHRRELRGDDSAAGIIAALVSCADALAAPAGTRWGIAMPGPFDYDTGIARYTGVAKFEALDGVDLRTALVAQMTSRPAGVYFVNDAAAFVLGEWAAGAAVGYRRAVGVTLGTGVGSAFLADGRIVADGTSVPPGGEIFRTAYRGAPIEETVSRRALLRRYRQANPAAPAEIDVRDVANLALGGDSDAARLFTDVFAAFGHALGPYLDRFGAEVLVVGGSIAQSWELVHDPIRAGLHDYAASLDTVVLSRAEHLHDAPLLGAAFAAAAEPG